MNVFNFIRLFFMCEIGELTRTCGGATPGLSKLYVVDTHDVVSIPLPGPNWTIVSNIILKPGKFWKDIPFVEQKAGLSDEIADAVGGGFKTNLPIKLAKYSAQTNKWINNAIGARFLAVVVDNQDQMILVGNLNAAMRLEKATGTTGQKAGDENGWDLNLTAESVKPCFFYTGSILLETETITYDEVLTFASSTLADAAEVASTAAATNANLKFEFEAIDAPEEDNNRMDLFVSAVAQLAVDYPADYEGKPYRFTDNAGVVHTGVFTDGDVNF